jgi:hypothetical protein
MTSELPALLDLLSGFDPALLAQMEPEELREFEELTNIPKPLWEPFPGPQTMVYTSRAHELFYGGSAGSGKTGLGVGLSLTQHRRSLLLRRQAVQVVEIVDQLKRFAGSKGWRGSRYGGILTTLDGRMVEVGGCDHEDDKEKYQGRPHDLIFFDEAVHFSREQYRFISAWNRHEDPAQQCRVVCGSNPPTTPEGRWVVEEFAPWLDSEYPNAARAGELRWFTTLDDKLTWVDGPEPFMHEGERIVPRSRTFVPGRLVDNPILAATDYGARLQALPEPLRSQLLYGDFSAGMSDDPWQVIPTAWVRDAMRRWTPRPPEGLPMTCVGVDVARGGKDKTVLSSRYGPWFAPLKRWQGSETNDGPKVAALVVRERKDSAEVNVDVIGIGSSVYDCLKGIDFFKTNPVNNAEAAPGTDRSGRLRFVNIRAASYWRLREALDPNGDERIMLPPDNELLADLCAPHYKVMTNGIQLEKKDDIIERIGRSPDAGDAVALAWWGQPRMMGAMQVRSYGGRKAGKVVVCTHAELAELDLDQSHKCLVVDFADPLPEDDEYVPPALMIEPLDELAMQFVDLEPADHQATWGSPVEPWGKPASELAMQPQDGRKLWAFLNRRRDPTADVRIFTGCQRRAMTAALAFCDFTALERDTSIYLPSDPYNKVKEDAEPPCRHMYQTMKATRGAVL